MKAWTDYPFAEFGDLEGQLAPIREVKLLSYDGDKYITVQYQGVTKDIKRGYVYMERGRCGRVPALNRRVLSHLSLSDSKKGDPP